MDGSTAPRGGRKSGVSWTAAILLVAAVALAFQGSRGLWEPDEGFYANAALDMARTGDRLVPRVNGAIFLDKPPLRYWGMAAGVVLLGDDEWGLRLANVMWITLAAIAVGATAGRMWGTHRRAFGTLAYGVMLGPVLAANVLPPDTPLACFVALLGFAYSRSAIAVACWVVALVGIKATFAFAPIPAAHPLDSRALAGELRSAGVRPDAELVAIDSKENGLVAYGFTHLTWVRDRRPPYPFFVPPGPLEPALAEIAARRPRQVALLVRTADRQGVLDRLPGGLRSCVPSDGEEFVLLECAPTVSSPVGLDRGGGR